MAEVFISYAREDRPRADVIARALQAMGLDVFWDTEIPPGQTWADYIEGKLSQCNAVVVLWSENSTKSQWVREEARMGRERGRLIPVLLDASPSPFGFGEVQAADLASWNGDPNHPGWQRFSNAVFTAARGAQAQAQPQPQYQAPPAPEPQPQQYYTPPPGAAPHYGYAPPPQGGALSPIAYVQKCFRLFVDGKGRARRAEYWWWAAFSVVAALIAGVIDLSFGLNPYTGMPNSQILSAIVGLALIAPTVSVTSRRLHDIGMNGWIAAAPIAASMLAGVLGPIGAILSLLSLVGMIVIGVLPGLSGDNQYGPDPKAG